MASKEPPPCCTTSCALKTTARILVGLFEITGAVMVPVSGYLLYEKGVEFLGVEMMNQLIKLMYTNNNIDRDVILFSAATGATCLASAGEGVKNIIQAFWTCYKRSNYNNRPYHHIQK